MNEYSICLTSKNNKLHLYSYYNLVENYDLKLLKKQCSAFGKIANIHTSSMYLHLSEVVSAIPLCQLTNHSQHPLHRE